MLQNVVHFPVCKILAPARNVPVRREKPIEEVMSVRNRWPFTVNEGYAAMLTREAQFRGPADVSSFVS